MPTLSITNSWNAGSGVVDPTEIEANISDIQTFHNANAIDKTNFRSNSVPTIKMADSCINGDKPQANVIMSEKIEDDTVDNTLIADGSIQDKNIDWVGETSGRPVRRHCASTEYRPLKLGKGSASFTISGDSFVAYTGEIAWASLDEGNPPYIDHTSVVVLGSVKSSGDDHFEFTYVVSATGINFRVTRYLSDNARIGTVEFICAGY